MFFIQPAKPFDRFDDEWLEKYGSPLDAEPFIPAENSSWPIIVPGPTKTIGVNI